MVNISEISISVTEGDKAGMRRTFNDWLEAEKLIRELCYDAPENGGGYRKIMVLMTWQDGFELKMRYDMQRHHAVMAAPLRISILEKLKFYSGLYKPEWMDEERYRVSITNADANIDFICNYNFCLLEQEYIIKEIKKKLRLNCLSTLPEAC